MATRTTAGRRGLSPATMLLMMTGLFLTGGTGAIAALWSLGYVEIPWLRRATGPQAPDREGMIAVPASAAAIPAYTKLTREHFLDKRNSLSTIWLPKEAVTPEMLTDLNQVLGRVLSRDKAPGYIFTERDLMPKGTRPGLVGGIPPGKRAVVLPADKLQGIHGLNPGDRVDLLASMPVNFQRSLSRQRVGLLYSSETNTSKLPKQAAVKVLVDNGTLVTAITTRQPAASTTKGPPPKPMREITLAIDPEEIVAVTEALEIGASIIAVARSGHPDDTLTSAALPQREETVDNIVAVETMRGFRRETLLLPTDPQPEVISAAAVEATRSSHEQGPAEAPLNATHGAPSSQTGKAPKPY